MDGSERRSVGRGGDADVDEGSTVVQPGRATPTARRYPVTPLAQALAGSDGDRQRPTAADVATAAIDNKTAGVPVDPAVSSKVGAHLGADFGHVQVHTDPLARESAAAMGARAFAHGSDVFLGPGESSSDLGLMAHELTHVVQQGAARDPAVQRQVEVGAASSPAEREADEVAERVTGGAPPQQQIVEDAIAELQPGQMHKGAFLGALRPAVTAAADAELGPAWSALGCPYIDQYFTHYAGQSAEHVERAIKKFAPEVSGAPAAAAYIPAIVNRVRSGVRSWVDTGAMPADAAAIAPNDAQEAARASHDAATGQPATETGSGAQTKPAPGAAPVDEAGLATDPAAVQRELGHGAPLDSAAASRMGDAMGESFADVRVHTDDNAARLAASQGAVAFTVGSDIAFGAGEYQPQTPEGDALLAHELAHVVQQRGADPTAGAGVAVSSAHEEDADHAAVGVMTRLYGGAVSAMRTVGENVRPALTSGFGLRRCESKKTFPVGSATPTGSVTHTTGKQADDYLKANAVIGTYIKAKYKGGTKAEGKVHFYDKQGFRDANWVRVQDWTNDATGKKYTRAESDAYADGLEGFAYGGGIYVNQEKGGPDTVIHEAIHLFQDGALESTCGRMAKEGATEFFTIEVAKANGLTPSHSYRDAEGAISKLAGVVGKDTVAKAFFDGDIATLKSAVDTAKGAGTFDKWAAEMKAEDYAKANALL